MNRVIVMFAAVMLAAPAALAEGANDAGAPKPAATQPTTRPAEAQEPPGAFEGLTALVGKLGWYFGPVGLASIGTWMLVWVILIVRSVSSRSMGLSLGVSILAGLAVVYVYSIPDVGPFVGPVIWLGVFAAMAVVAAWAVLGREVPAVFAALILSVAGLGLTLWNSDNVLEIEEDRSAILAAARKRQMRVRQAEIDKLRGEAADIHFAEDGAGDAMDLAGYKQKDANALAAPADYDYRAGGKKRRDPNKIVKDDPLADFIDDPADERAGFGGGARRLPGADYVLANQLDTINRFAARLTLLVALILAAVEYLQRFNRTFGSILPLPLACRAVDSLWPKSHCVHFRTADAGRVRHYLETAVRKGESFICFTPRDPWPGEDVRLGRLPIRWLWPLRKIACRPGDAAYGSEFVFESAWFGRYAFVVLADALDAPLTGMLDELLDLLRMRRHTHATAARTVNLIWDLPTAPPAETLEELACLCTETNLKFILSSPDAPPADVEGLFDEIHAW